ncbi:MAG: MFS transporter [Candidatus Bathyarchaeia archaeon]
MEGENSVKSEGFAVSLRFLFVLVFFMQMLTGVVGLAVPISAVGMGASPLFLGFIGAVGGLTYSFMPLAAGFFSDRVRRKSFILAALVLYGLSCVLYFLAGNPVVLVPVKALEWVSVSVFWPSVEALLTESSRDRVEQSLRRFNLSWGSATIVGPVVGGLVISLFGVKVPFVLSSTVSFALAFFAAVAVRESIKGGHKPTREASQPQKRGSGSIAAALASTLLFSFVGGIIYNLFPAHATSLGIQPYEIGVVMFFNGLFRLAAFFEAYRIEGKIGKIGMFLAGSLTLAFACGLTLASSTTAMFILTFSFFGFGTGLLYAASIAFILKSWSSSKGYAAGLFESLIGVGSILGSSTGGFVSEFYALNAPYLLGLCVSLAISFFHSVHMFRKRR